MVPALPAHKLTRNLMSRKQKGATRIYGGAICGKSVRERIITVSPHPSLLLVEEQKIVKKVLKHVLDISIQDTDTVLKKKVRKLHKSKEKIASKVIKTVGLQ